jgi:hypothetical protein
MMALLHRFGFCYNNLFCGIDMNIPEVNPVKPFFLLSQETE